MEAGWFDDGLIYYIFINDRSILLNESIITWNLYIPHSASIPINENSVTCTFRLTNLH